MQNLKGALMCLVYTVSRILNSNPESGLMSTLESTDDSKFHDVRHQKLFCENIKKNTHTN